MWTNSHDMAPSLSYPIHAMQLIISPAKTMTGQSPVRLETTTTPLFQREANEIAWHMTHLSTEELKRSLKLSPKLALETYQRFQAFHATDIPGLPALLAYTGVVYKHIHPEDFTPEDFSFARQHLKIASICYGLLSASDVIKPYRMEYDVKIPELTEGNMYSFWQERQTRPLIDAVRADDGILLNLASQEIQPAFFWKQVEKEVRVITPEFKIRKDGKLKTIVIYTKMARGEMCRQIIRRQIQDPEAIKAFDWEGFLYREDLSTENNWVFLQD